MRLFNAVRPHLNNFANKVERELAEWHWRTIAISAFAVLGVSLVIRAWADHYLATHSLAGGSDVWIFRPIALFFTLNDIELQVARSLFWGACNVALWHAVPWVARRLSPPEPQPKPEDTDPPA